MKRYLVVFYLFISVSILWLLNFTSLGHVLNLRALDLFRISHPPHPEIVILAIDNKSLQKIGRWPWDRSVHAKVVDKLTEIKPQIVGLDITLTEEQNEDQDLELARALKNVNYPLVLATQPIFTTGSSAPAKILSPLKIFLQNKLVTTGQTDVRLDIDGISRISPKIPSFSFQLAKNLNVDLPISEFLINFAGEAGSFTTYSISDLLDNNISQDKLQGKIILVGATASDLHDTVLIPPGKLVSGVEWNGNVLDNLLLKRQINPVSKIVSFFLGVLIVVLYLLVFTRVSARKVSWLLVFFILLLPVLSFILWQFNLSLFYFSALTVTAGLFVFHGLYRWYISEAEKRKLRQTFQYYFSPSVLAEIIKNPMRLKLGGERREVTILFSDIRGFTTITESLPPEKLTGLLHQYFTEMSKEILATDGVLDKFIGDAIMAFWGAPVHQDDHADRAVKSALNMIKRLKALQKKWKSESLPEIEAGVGINTGVVTVGNMGSEDRFDYTIIGDAVNAAARLESLNKEFKTSIIISGDTKDKLTKKIKLRNLGQVLVKGKTKPLKIYSI